MPITLGDANEQPLLGAAVELQFVLYNWCHNPFLSPLPPSSPPPHYPDCWALDNECAGGGCCAFCGAGKACCKGHPAVENNDPPICDGLGGPDKPSYHICLPLAPGTACPSTPAPSFSPPPLPPAPPPPHPSPPSLSVPLFSLISGSCNVASSPACISSPGYPNDYPASTDCVIGISSPVRLRVEGGFDVESPSATGACYDYIQVRALGESTDLKYCGRNSPDGVIADPEVSLKWVADASVQGKSWKICGASPSMLSPPPPSSTANLPGSGASGLSPGQDESAQGSSAIVIVVCVIIATSIAGGGLYWKIKHSRLAPQMLMKHMQVEGPRAVELEKSASALTRHGELETHAI